MADREQPWAERTVEVPPDGAAWPSSNPPPAHPPLAPPPAYHRGVAPVSGAPPRRKDSTQEYRDLGPTPWEQPAPPRAPLRYRFRQLRRGGEWTWIGGLFAFICWGIWTVSVRGDDFVVPALAFVLVLLVAVGVFTLSRLLGMVILERGMGRVRRSAWGAHLATGLFLAAAGLAYLGQTAWVVDAWNWLRGLS